MKAQGLGVHKPEEIEEFGKQDLKVLSELLADKPFFFGDEPTTVRAQTHSQSINLISNPSVLVWIVARLRRILRPGSNSLHFRRCQVRAEGIHAGELPEPGRTRFTDQGALLPRLGRYLHEAGSERTSTEARVSVFPVASLLLVIICVTGPENLVINHLAPLLWREYNLDPSLSIGENVTLTWM